MHVGEWVSGGIPSHIGAEYGCPGGLLGHVAAAAAAADAAIPAMAGGSLDSGASLQRFISAACLWPPRTSHPRRPSRFVCLLY